MRKVLPVLGLVPLARKKTTVTSFFCFTLVMLTVLASCASSPSMQVMYMQEGVPQYTFFAENSQSGAFTLSFEISFRDEREIGEPAIIEITMQCRNDDPFLPVSFAFRTGSGSLIEASKPALISIDRSGNLVRMRSKMRRDTFLRILNEHPADVVLGLGNNASISFRLNERTQRELSLLQSEVAP